MNDPADMSGKREIVGPRTLAEATSLPHRLWLAVIPRPLDFEPYGVRVRDSDDCSCGCVHFVPLAGDLGADWGVCANVRSQRCGLLTWEHMGCPEFEPAGKPDGGTSTTNESEMQ
jgi:hypothetical protein